MPGIFIGFLSSAAFGGVPAFPQRPAVSDYGLAKTSFYRAVSELNEMGRSLEILSASVNVVSSDGVCSGSFVSDDGHILLASHCLETCKLDWKLAIAKRGSPPDIWCTVTVNGRRQRAHLDLASRCNAVENLKNEIEDFREGSPGLRRKCESGDLAILKLESPPQDFACLPINAHSPPVGSTVFTIGTPDRTYRPGDGNSLGDGTVYLSKGYVINRSTCLDPSRLPDWMDRIFGGTLDWLRTRKLRRGIEFLNRRLIQTTVDTFRGSSGGALIDEANEVVGVASTVSPDVQNDRRECQGATFFERLDKLTSTMKEWDPDYDLSRIKCECRRVGRWTSTSKELSSECI